MVAGSSRMSALLSLLMLTAVAAFSPTAAIGRRPAFASRRPSPTMIAEDQIRTKLEGLQAMTPAQIQVEIDLLEKQLEIAKLRQQLALREMAASNAAPEPAAAAPAPTVPAAPTAPAPTVPAAPLAQQSDGVVVQAAANHNVVSATLGGRHQSLKEKDLQQPKLEEPVAAVAPGVWTSGLLSSYGSFKYAEDMPRYKFDPARGR